MRARIDASHLAVVLFLLLVLDEVQVGVSWVKIFGLLERDLATYLKIEELGLSRLEDDHDSVARCVA